MKVKERLTPTRLKAFFRPKNIALIGATDNSRWSMYTFMNLVNSKFSGNIYCVNPRKTIVHGQKAYHSVLDIAEPIDLAYVMVSTKNILEVMKETSDAGIRNLVLLTSGFGEIGEEGRELERQVLSFSREHDQVILGPNGNGFIHVTEQIMPYGLPLTLPLTSGSVGVVLQSGALASSVLTLAEARYVGLSLLVSMGNESMITTTDLIDYMIEDESTRVIALFLESIRQPEEFSRIAKKALAYGKPIIALKIGRSAESARTAMAHTGALVGDDKVNDAVFKQLGVIRVNSLEGLITTAGLMSSVPPLLGRKMGVVTPSGGACDIISDRACDEQILLPPFAQETMKKLTEIVPKFSTVHNPLDVTGYVVVDRTLSIRALEAVIHDPCLDFVLFLMEPLRTEPDDPEPFFQQYEEIRKVISRSPIPIIFIMNTALEITPFGKTISEKGNIHFVGGIEHGMSAIGKALWWYEKKRSISVESYEEPVTFTDCFIPGGQGTWSEYKSREFLKRYDIPVVPGILAKTKEETAAAAKMVGFPIVMKIQSDHIAHKSDVGGVVLNVQTESEAVHEFSKILENFSKHNRINELEGVLICPMRKDGIELFVGIVKDTLWGQTLVVGLGGVFIEVLKDTSIRVLPVNQVEIKEMLLELKGAQLLHGIRGGSAVNINKLVNVIYKITRAAMSKQASLLALEINPLFVKENQVEAMDALIEWSEK